MEERWRRVWWTGFPSHVPHGFRCRAVIAVGRWTNSLQAALYGNGSLAWGRFRGLWRSNFVLTIYGSSCKVKCTMSGAGGNCNKESATSAPNTPPLPRRPCPIVPGYQRSSGTAEPQRVSRFSLRSSSEGSLSGGDRSRTAPSVACEELEHSEESIQDSSAECR